MAQVIYTSGASLTTPADYDDATAVWEAIGAGGNGAKGSTNGGGGGGGGEYRKITAPGLAANTTYDINIPSGGAGAGADLGTWLKNGAGGGGSVILEARNGSNASGNNGGSGGTGGTGTAANFNGGNGANGGAGGGTRGSGGGGGSAGPTGAGKNGGAGNASANGAGGGGGGSNGGSSTDGAAGIDATTGGAGGHGTGGSGGGVQPGGDGTAGTGAGGAGGGSGGNNGGHGAIDSAFDGTHGAGGGGGGCDGSAVTNLGGNGGTYGGGGGGVGATNGVTPGTGGQGILVLTYTPAGAIVPDAANLSLSRSIPIVQVGLKQILRPDGDVTDGSWTTNSGGSNLSQAIDELNADDADYIQSGLGVDEDTCEVSLTNQAGGIQAPYKVRYRFGKKGVGGAMELDVWLVQGTTVIASWYHGDVAVGNLDAEQTLSDDQAALVTDPNDLRLRFTARRYEGPPRTNLMAWYKKGTGFVTSSGLISEWKDSSGNGRHLTQPTAGNRPTLLDDDIVRNDGVDNFLSVAFTLNQPFTVYMLVRQRSWTSGRQIYGSTATVVAIRQKPTGSGGATPEIEIFAGSGAGEDANLALNTFGVVTAVFNGASSFLGVNQNAGETLDPGANNASGVSLGSDIAVAAPSASDFREVVVYSGAHDAEQRAEVIEYLYGAHADPVPHFMDTGATQPWYGMSIPNNAAYFADTNKLFVTWEASIPPGSGSPRYVYGREYDLDTSTWADPVLVGDNTLTDDDHGVPTLCRDDDGYIYCFYGSHNSGPQQISVTTNPNDTSSWTELSGITGNYSYPHPIFVDGVIYLFWRDDLIDGDRRLTVTKSTSLTGGVPSWAAKTSLVSLGPDARFYSGNFIPIGTDIHIIATRAPQDDSNRKHVYYFVYDTVTGDIRNYDDTFTVASGDQPVDLTEANANYRIYEHTGADEGQVPTLRFDTDGNPHVIFPVNDALFHIWHNGSSWQSPVDTGFDTDGGFQLVQRPSGVMRMYWPWLGTIRYAERSAGGVWGPDTKIAEPPIGVSAFQVVGGVMDSIPEAEIVFADFNSGVVSVERGTIKGYAYGVNGFL